MRLAPPASRAGQRGVVNARPAFIITERSTPEAWTAVAVDSNCRLCNNRPLTGAEGGSSVAVLRHTRHVTLMSLFAFVRELCRDGDVTPDATRTDECRAAGAASSSATAITAQAGAKASAENFPVALRFLPRRYRGHLAAVYGFARSADDMGDEAAPGERLCLLDELEADVGRLYRMVSRAGAPGGEGTSGEGTSGAGTSGAGTSGAGTSGEGPGSVDATGPSAAGPVTAGGPAGAGPASGGGPAGAGPVAADGSPARLAVVRAPAPAG